LRRRAFAAGFAFRWIVSSPPAEVRRHEAGARAWKLSRGPAFLLASQAMGKLQMTTAKKADRRAAEKGSGQGGTSNAGGTSTGPGSSSGSGTRKDNQGASAGAASKKAATGRPGHKTGG
jgi:hypothetical protein